MRRGATMAGTARTSGNRKMSRGRGATSLRTAQRDSQLLGSVWAGDHVPSSVNGHSPRDRFPSGKFLFEGISIALHSVLGPCQADARYASGVRPGCCAPARGNGERKYVESSYERRFGSLAQVLSTSFSFSLRRAESRTSCYGFG